MSAPLVIAVEPGSPAALAGVEPGDEILALNGEVPRDIIEYRLLTDEAELSLDISRGGLGLQIDLQKNLGEPLGAEIQSALFDQVRTCDNHCEFCFIYQLPPGMRQSLYLKDDDYRLSFLYGNFTTLTRFTEADFERVVTERISPLHVSIHATDPDIRATLLRNRRGATSLRWLRALLDHGIEIHGQIVVCPDRNNGEILDDTLAGILDLFPELASICVVPLGVSRYNTESAMRPHTQSEAVDVVRTVEGWQEVFRLTLGHRLVFAADEYYLLADVPFPEASTYEGFPMHEDGVGMARTFELEFNGEVDQPTGVANGFFAWVDGAPPEGYRAPRSAPAPDGVGRTVSLRPSARAPIGILTGPYGAAVLRPLIAPLERDDIRIIEVENQYFGGNTAVTGLMTGSDIARVLSGEPEGHRYLLPDVCLSQGRFLDGTTPEDLPRPVELVPTDGIALRAALEQR
jgi:putative radical SAM enzyme (TIGR03279 family)